MIDDPRRQASCRHGRLNLLRQRLHALCPGHEDLNDHDELRHDAALQTAICRDTARRRRAGSSPRRIVPGLSRLKTLYFDRVYCARGEMENHIREQQPDLFADRTSCSLWWPNQYRMLPSGLVHVLPERLRRNVLYGTRLARVHVGTLRLKLLRIGAVIVRNTRRVVLMLSGSCPYQDLFRLAVQRLAP